MNESTDICQACLSNERLLSPLWKLESLLREIEEWKLKLSKGGVCWECRNLILKFYNFKARVCKAQDTLSYLGMAQNITCLSTMATSTKNRFDHDYFYFDGNTNEQIEGVPITVKQELIEQYNHENPDLNIEIGSPRTERTSELERCLDTHNGNSSPTIEQNSILVKESQNMEHTTEARQVVESMEGVDMQILVNIKTEIEDSNPNSPLALVSEEVQVKDEPVSEGDYTITDSYIDDSMRHSNENLNHASANELSCLIGPEPAATNESAKEHKKWENSVMLVYKRCILPKMEILPYQETEDLNNGMTELLSQRELQEDCKLPESEILKASPYPFNAVEQENDAQKRRRRRKDYCLYCRTKVFNFGLHLVRNHWNEDNVQKLISLPTKSKDRIRLREQLKDIGNNLNKLTLSQPINIKIEKNVTNDLPGTVSLTQDISNDPLTSNLDYNLVLPFNIEKVNEGSVISAFEKQCDGSNEEYCVSIQKMQMLSQLLIELKRTDPNIKNLLDSFQPQYFSKIYDAIKTLANGSFVNMVDLFSYLNNYVDFTLNSISGAENSQLVKEYLSIMSVQLDKWSRETKSVCEPKTNSSVLDVTKTNLIKGNCDEKPHKSWENNILTQNSNRLQNHKTCMLQNAQNNNEVKPIYTGCDTVKSKNFINSPSESLNFTKSNIFTKQRKNRLCSLASEQKCVAKMFFKGNAKEQTVPNKCKIDKLLQKYNEMCSNKSCRSAKHLGDCKVKKELKYNICFENTVNELKFKCHINPKRKVIDAAVAKTKKCKNKRKVIPWTNEQKWWTKEYFKSHIENKKVPKKREIENLIHEHPEIFFDKDVARIRVFVQNVYTNKYNRKLLNRIDNIFQQVKDDSSLGNNKLINSNRNPEQNLKKLNKQSQEKSSWSTEQRKVIKEHFKNYIDSKLIPQKDLIEDLRDKYPDLFFNKNWLQIKILLFDKYTQKGKPNCVLKPNGSDDKKLSFNNIKLSKSTAVINEKIKQKPKTSYYNHSSTVVKCPWTNEQNLLIEQHFKRHIKNYTLPKKAEIDNFIKDHSKLYDNKNWLKIRLYIFNKYLKKTKKYYYNTESVENTDNSPVKYDSEKHLDIDYIQTTASSDNWSAEQKRIISERFSTCISDNILPQKNEIEDFLKYRTNMFSSKKYSDVLSLLQNLFVTKQKIPWSNEQKLVIEEYFQNHIENSIYPNKIEAENFIKKYPQLYYNKNFIKVQLYVLNASKRKYKTKKKPDKKSTSDDIDFSPVSKPTKDVIEFEYKKPNNTANKATSIKKTEKTCGSKFREMPWTKEQKRVAKKYFKYHVQNRITPTKLEVENFMKQNPDLYNNKNWQKIKVFIYNENKKQSREINFDEKANMLNALGLVRETNRNIKFGEDGNENEKGKDTYSVMISSDHSRIIREHFDKYLVKNILPSKARMEHFLKNNVKVSYDVNQLRLFLQENFNEQDKKSHLKNNYGVTRYNKGRCRWTVKQKQVIEQYFKQHIKNRVYPKKIEADIFLKKNRKLYHNKNSTKVRVFVQNTYKRMYGTNKNKITTNTVNNTKAVKNNFDKIKLLDPTNSNMNSIGSEFSDSMESSLSNTVDHHENREISRGSLSVEEKVTASNFFNSHTKNHCVLQKSFDEQVNESCSKNFDSVTKNKKVWSRWTIEQKRVIEEYFKHHIENKIYPKKIEAEMFLRNYSRLYYNKNATKVRVFVQNAYNRGHRTNKHKIPTNSSKNTKAAVTNFNETKTLDHTNSNIKSIRPEFSNSIESPSLATSCENHENCKLTKVLASVKEDILEYNEDWQKIRLIKYNELFKNPSQNSFSVNIVNDNTNVKENEKYGLTNVDDACPNN